ncbi:hypothetical protein ACFWIR_38285, partial [Streptomyces olivaceus]
MGHRETGGGIDGGHGRPPGARRAHRVPGPAAEWALCGPEAAAPLSEQRSGAAGTQRPASQVRLTSVSTCSTVSRDLDEPVSGTAPVARTWLLLEQPGPWGAKALTSSHLEPALGRALEAAAKGTGVGGGGHRRPRPPPGPPAPSAPRGLAGPTQRRS